MKTAYIALLIVILGACRIAQPYRQPAAATDSLYRNSINTDSTGLAGVPLASFFADTQLQRLLQLGLQRNLDLKKAMERIHMARAAFRQSKAALLPEVSANAGIKQSKLSFPQGFGLVKNSTQYDVYISTSWEADIWGKISSAKRAALAQLLATETARKAIQTQLAADIANHYYRLLALDAQQQIVEKTIANRQEDAQAMKTLKNSGVVNGAAVVQSEANLYTAEMALPALKRQVRETENALQFLLANAPGPVQRGSLAASTMPATVQTGVPAQLLQYRPDVLQAEHAFRAAFENTNAARAYFYPALSITAAAGYSSFSFRDWFTPAGLFANVAGGLAQPILNKRMNKTRLEVARATQEEALLHFSQTLLKAGQEVSDALYAYQTAEEQQTIRTRQLQSLEQSVDFTKKLLRYSTATNYTDVLTSEQALLAAQLDAVNDRLLQWQSVIGLYRALGGGWQ